MVAGVKRLYEAYPSVVQPIFTSIQGITDTFIRMVGKLANQGYKDEHMFYSELVSSTRFFTVKPWLDSLNLFDH